MFLQPSRSKGEAWQWEYAVRDANGSETTGVDSQNCLGHCNDSAIVVKFDGIQDVKFHFFQRFFLKKYCMV